MHPIATKKKIQIIGAGLAGLGIGWRLAQAGHNVTIYERGSVGQEASWAGAGMLAAALEAEPGEDLLLPFTMKAQDVWTDFTRELEDYTGLTIGYRESGTLFVAVEADDVGILRHRQDFLAAHGIKVEWLEYNDIKAREPSLAPCIRNALYSAQDHQVDNRALVKALHEACKKAGVIIHEHTPVESVYVKNGELKTLLTPHGEIDVEHAIFCTGAWAGEIKGLPQGAAPPVYPMKGQVLCLQMNPQQPLLRHVVWTPHVYLVPRDDGRLIVGATMEDKGFDTTMTAGGMLHLLRRTWEALPDMEELPLVESWAGLRPTSRDDAPILGPSDVSNLSYATGQHRHGILMTPLIASVMERYITHGELPDIAKDFTMARFKRNWFEGAV